MSVSCSSSRSKQRRVTWAPSYCLYCCLVFMKSDQLAVLFGRIHNKFVIISARGYVVTFRAPLQTTNLLWMSTILISNSISKIPCCDCSIPWATCKQATGPVQTANSSAMTIEIVDLFSFANIKYFNLSHAISDCKFVLITEGNRTDVIADLAGLVEFSNLGGATRPYIEGWIKCDSNLVVIRPIKEVEIEIILEVGGI